MVYRLKKQTPIIFKITTSKEGEAPGLFASAAFGNSIITALYNEHPVYIYKNTRSDL